jgi:hypothetical protein
MQAQCQRGSARGTHTPPRRRSWPGTYLLPHTELAKPLASTEEGSTREPPRPQEEKVIGCGACCSKSYPAHLRPLSHSQMVGW